MKYFFHFVLACAFLSTSAAAQAAQSRVDLKSKPIGNELLAAILNQGEMKELTPKDPSESNYFLRLYSLDDISNDNLDSTAAASLGTCAPQVETEVVCGYRYLLAVHTGDLGFSGFVYDLGLVGEIAKIELLKKTDSEVDRLRLDVTNYPAHAFKLNPKLVKKTKKFEIIVRSETLDIKEVE